MQLTTPLIKNEKQPMKKDQFSNHQEKKAVIVSNKIDFPVYFKRTRLSDEILESVALTRYAIKDGKPDRHDIALSTDAGMAFVTQGVSNWKVDVMSEQGILPHEELPEMITVKATWYTAKEARAHGIKVVSGESANVFGGMGTLLVPDDFCIPTTMATKQNVKYYGLELIENNRNLTVISDNYDIVMMKYDYKHNYKREFLLQEHGGGGIFIEKHEFPHVHIPLSAECGGYIVIGKQVSAHEFNFTAFQIPYKYALYTPSNTIHGDGTLVGEYGLTVADPETASANTVLIYNEHTKAMADDVVPDWKPES